MTDNGSISVTIDNMPENPIIIAYGCDKNGNIIDTGVFVARTYLSSLFGYSALIRSGSTAWNYSGISVNGNVITFKYISMHEVGYYIHYIII